MSLQPYLESSGSFPVSEVLRFMQTWITQGSTYKGIPCCKNPLDLWMYQNIIHEVKPDTIIEIGTLKGGSALWLADQCELAGKGKVISVDQNPAPDFTHPRITWVTNGSDHSFEEVKSKTRGVVLVIEDSSHELEQCLNVLRLYGSLVTVGSYLIVEDTICHHGLPVGPWPGPWEAIDVFLKETSVFVPDRSREPYVITWNPRGYLRRLG
jgi:cephalosporin hydroxylase